jgi:hypothetical protein
LYSVGILFLINTVHQGTRLVHEFGVGVNVSAPGVQPLEPPKPNLAASRGAIRQGLLCHARRAYY